MPALAESEPKKLMLATEAMARYCDLRLAS